VTGTLQKWLASRWSIVAVDVLIVSTVYAAALLFRFEGAIPDFYASRFASILPLIATTYVIVGFLARIYTPTTSLRRVSGVAFVSGISIVVVVAMWPGAIRPIPLSVLALGALGSLVGLIGVRALAWRSRRGFA
jgi:hypothetical protein